jgi:hypothetical protein
MMTTLNAIRAHSPCADGWTKLLRHLGKTHADDDPLPIATILDSNGIDDALWCLRAVTGHDRESRLYAVWCARRVQHLMTDPRSIAALDVAERRANGAATDADFRAAWDAAEAAAMKAAEAAAWAAAWAAADAAWAAADAARAAVRAVAAATRDAERDAQSAELRRVCAAIGSGDDPYPRVTLGERE